MYGWVCQWKNAQTLAIPGLKQLVLWVHSKTMYLGSHPTRAGEREVNKEIIVGERETKTTCQSFRPDVWGIRGPIGGCSSTHKHTHVHTRKHSLSLSFSLTHPHIQVHTLCTVHTLVCLVVEVFGGGAQPARPWPTSEPRRRGEEEVKRGEKGRGEERAERERHC